MSYDPTESPPSPAVDGGQADDQADDQAIEDTADQADNQGQGKGTEPSPSTPARAPSPPFGLVRRLARQHRPSELLPVIARVAARVSEPSDDSLQRWRTVAPWTLAGLARESILYSRASAPSGITEENMRQMLNAYTQSHHPLPDTPDSVFTLMTSHAYDQMLYQESDGQELTRTVALLSDELAPNAHRLKVIDTDVVTDLVAGPIEDALRASMILWAYASKQHGHLPEDISTSRAMTGLKDYVSPETLHAVAELMTANVPTLRRAHRSLYNTKAPLPPYLVKYAYNPLTAHPIVRTGRRLVAPQLRLIRRRFAPAGIFYAGVSRYGNDFATDLGYLYETYIGRTLAQIAGATIHGEVRYRDGKDKKETVDWFIVLPDLVVLVESKATRPDLDLRTGNPGLGRALKTQLTKSIDQLAVTNELLDAGHPALAHIPNDRPRVGLVVTAEPFYLGNSPNFRGYLPEPAIPTQFASVRDLEQLAGYDAATLESGLKVIVSDPDLSTWGPLHAMERATGSSPASPTGIMEALNDRLIPLGPDDLEPED